MWKVLSLAKQGPYFYARVPDHPNATVKGYVLHHRIVMENHLGRVLEDDEDVHHMNEDKRDNRIQNLELMMHSEHSRHHSKESKNLDLTCAYCGSSFQRKFNQRAEVKGYTRTFCSRSCNGKYQRRKQLCAPVR